MAEEDGPNHLILFAVLGILFFGKEEDNFLDNMQKLGVVRLSNSTSSSPGSEKEGRARQLIRSASVNAYGRFEIERQFGKGTQKFSVSAKTTEPIKLKALDNETFLLKEKELRLSCQLRDVELHHVNNYEIRGIRSLSKEDSAKIKFRLPDVIKLTCRYQVQGVVSGKNVHDGGTAEIKLTGVDVFGKVRVNVASEHITITELNLAYSVGKLEIEKIGLTLPGMGKDEVIKMVNTAAKKYITENMVAIADHIANEMKTKLNAKLEKISKVGIVKSVDTSEDEERN